ncbi:hypothetical protein [Streptomyces sp. NPDC048442]|uniref:hypothetical protein n=1 Tax=Streptomyces sp. NPDC048442 TaxID=3154823 RepID=UPI0034381F09
MLRQSSSSGPQNAAAPEVRKPVRLAPRLCTGPGTATSYAAFCQDYGRVYRQYASSVTGCAVTGGRLADVAFRELGAPWHTVLRSAVPSALGWALLCATTASHRTATARMLHQVLGPRGADALVLYYRLGLTMHQVGPAMGVDPSTFDLCRRSALRKAACLGQWAHMPELNAL